MRYLITLVLMTLFATVTGQNVKMVKDDAKQKVDVLIDGTLFTSYCFPSNMEKPFLFPVYAPNGSVVTRGFPLAPRKGERVDHPHQVGIWFNHGNVNGLDFWNNSSAIPAEKKNEYGHIVVKKILKTESGKKGTLEVISEWQDNKGTTLIIEDAVYIFSGDKNTRTIDHISTLTAVKDTVIFRDNKEGMFAIRVDRAFEMPTTESVIFTDEKGNPTTVKAADTTGVSGMYYSSNGKTGDNVWGTRNEWVILNAKKGKVPVSLAIFDNPKNPGYPAYSHARGYGLFSVNNFGQNSYDPKMDKVNLTILKGKSVRLCHRFYIQTGSVLTPAVATKIFIAFANEY